MRIVYLLAAVLLPWLAEAEPITIDDSHSPNGKYFLTIEPHEELGTASGTMQIRENDTNEVVSAFEWEGFGVRPDSKVFRVLWDPASDAFAISYELSRGYMFYDAYAQHAGKWAKLKAPDYLAIIFKQQGISHGGGKGYETPIEWTNNETVRLNVGGRACTDQTDDVAFYYEAQVWLHLDKRAAPPRFTLEKIVNLPPTGG